MIHINQKMFVKDWRDGQNNNNVIKSTRLPQKKNVDIS